MTPSAEPFIIAGQERVSEAVSEVINPFDGQTVGSVHLAQPADIEDAIAGAVSGSAVMRDLPAYRRAEILAAAADGIAQRAEELALLIAGEAGKPLNDARGEVTRAIFNCRNAGEESKRISGHEVPLDVDGGVTTYQSDDPFDRSGGASAGHRMALATRVPLGPVLAVSPFNFPLNLTMHKVAPAIAAGNSVILKPPPQTPLTALRLGQILLEAGLPPEAISVVPCGNELAETMVTDDRLKMVSFTGSVKVGWHIKASAGKKRVTLELGGNGGVLIDASADLEYAARRVARGGFVFAGQYCIGVQRVIVEESCQDRFLELLMAETEKLQVGDPRLDATDVGPVIDDASATRIKSWIDEATAGGAKLLHGGERDGNVITPTILTGTTPDMKVEAEEIFGPVVTVNSFTEWQAGIDAVNDSDFGLQLGVFTQDLGRAMHAMRELEAGAVIVNDVPIYRIDSMPFGGVKDSGFGREGTKYAIESMTELKLLILNTLR